MGKFVLENQEKNTYLVYCVENDEKVDSVARGMLQNNYIDGLLNPAFVQKGEKQYLKYDITSKPALTEYFKEKMTKHRVLNLFQSIFSGMETAEEYMLMPEGFIFDMEHVYVDALSGKVSLLYLPLEEPKKKQDIRAFFKDMLTEMFYDENENLDYVGRLMNYFNQAEDFCMAGLNGALEKTAGEEEKPFAPKKDSISEEENDDFFEELEIPEDEEKASEFHHSFMGGSFDEDDNKTVIIGGGMEYDNGRMDFGTSQGRCIIIRRKNGQNAVINKDVFHIGKESSQADFYIGDNATISSLHADIICEDGRYFVRDMNSLNHTYINNVLVKPEEIRELHSGDVLKLANEEFDFKVE